MKIYILAAMAIGFLYIGAVSYADGAQEQAAVSSRTDARVRSQTSNTIKVFDENAFDGVGKPPSLPVYEYTSEQYDTWVAQCEPRKSESMEAFRQCFQQQKAETLGAQKRRIDAGGSGKPYRNIPAPSALEIDQRNPAFDAVSESTPD